MRQIIDKLFYLIFPAIGVLVALLIPADKLALRILVIVVISSLAFVAVDAKFSFKSVRNVSGSLRSIRGFIDRNRYLISAFFMLLAFVLMIYSAVKFAPYPDYYPDFTEPALLMIGGLVALWISLKIAPPSVQIVAVTNNSIQPLHSNLPVTLAGVALLLLSGEIGGRVIFVDMPRVPMWLQGVIFYGGITLLILGLGNIRSFPFKRSSIRTYLSIAWLREHSEVFIILLIFLGAFLVRVWDLETGLRVNIDEGPAIEGINHYYGGMVGLVARPSQYVPTLLFSQWQGELMNLLGRSVTTVRLTAVIVGSLTVVVVYLLARDLFKDRIAGVVAGLVLMTFPPHIHFSRLAHMHIADALFGTLAIWFIVKGIGSNRRLDWVLAGVSLGLTQYFFEAGRLFFVPLILGWFILALTWFIVVSIARRFKKTINPPPKISWHGIMIVTVAAIMTAMPNYYSTFSQGDDIFPRLTTSGGINLFTEPMDDGLTEEEAIGLVRRILFPFTVYVHQPEIAVLYGGDTPMMLVYVVPFFLMGMGYLLWRWRSPAFIITLWIVAAGLTNALLRDSAVFARWHVVFPAVAIVVAVGLRYLLPSIWTHVFIALRSREPAKNQPLSVTRQIAAVLGISLVVVISVAQLNYYYRWHVPLLEKQARLSKPYPDTFDVAFRSFGFPDNTSIYQISEFAADINVPQLWINIVTHADPATLMYLSLATSEIDETFMANLPDDQNLALFVDPNATAALHLLRQHFECDLQGSPFFMDPVEKGFLLCFVPASNDRLLDLGR